MKRSKQNSGELPRNTDIAMMHQDDDVNVWLCVLQHPESHETGISQWKFIPGE